MIRIGIIGGGMMSQIGHLPFYLHDPRCHVVGVAESRPSLIEALHRDHGIERVVPHHRELLQDPSVDAVIISAPRPATATITLEAIEAGKHVLAEKPMALTSADAHRLVEAAERHGVIYTVGFMKRCDPGVVAARQAFREVTADGTLGELVFSRFYNFTKTYAVPPPPHTRPAESRTERLPESELWPDWLPVHHRDAYGWILNAASHDLNLLHYFFDGEVIPRAARCQGKQSLNAMLETEGRPVMLEVAKSDIGTWREGAEFIFEHGRLTLEIPSPMATDATARAYVESLAKPGELLRLEADSGWSFERQAKDFLDALEGHATPLATGAEALRDMLLNDAIWRTIAANENSEKA